MSFTDDDLDRVRKYTKRGDILWEDLCGMLSRLEAAENVASLADGCEHHFHSKDWCDDHLTSNCSDVISEDPCKKLEENRVAILAWKKAAGK